MTRYPLTMASLAVFVLFLSASAMAQGCTPGVAVGTDQATYLQGSQVVISGQILDMDCSPVTVQDGIGISVRNPSSTVILVDQLGTNDLGEFSTSFKLPSDAALGEWTVYAAYGGQWGSGTFIVSGGECLDGETRQCGETDVGACSFGTETCVSGEWGSCEGAVGPVTEVCNDGIDNDCDGSVDEGCSSGGGGGGGTCLPKYECSAWGDCQPDGTQTRTCDRVAGCGTSSTPPAETQDCEYSAPAAACQESWSCSDWSSCDGGTQTRTCTDANSCGTTADKPAEAQSCEVSQPGTDNPGNSVTGLAIGDIMTSYGWVIVLLLVIIGAGAWKIMK